MNADERKIYCAEYYMNNREKSLAYTKAWQKDNPERNKENKNRLYKKTRKEVIARSQTRRAANKEKYDEQDRARYMAQKDERIIKQRARIKKDRAELNDVHIRRMIVRNMRHRGITRPVIIPDTVIRAKRKQLQLRSAINRRNANE
jgi:hypothetical protein